MFLLMQDLVSDSFDPFKNISFLFEFVFEYSSVFQSPFVFESFGVVLPAIYAYFFKDSASFYSELCVFFIALLRK